MISCACASYRAILMRNVGNELVTGRTGMEGWLISCACASYCAILLRSVGNELVT
jgi:hypothetical protein